MGARLDEQGCLFNHATWADNIVIIATDVNMLKEMAQQVTDAIYDIKVEWKPNSLEFLEGGTAMNAGGSCSVLTPSGTCLAFKRVQLLEILGVALDCAGSTPTSVSHRLAKADGCVWANAKAFHRGGTVQEKLRAWQLAPAACALFGSESWSLTKETLQKLRTWELGHLRRILRLRRRPGEGNFLYHTRTASTIDGWRAKLAIPHIIHRVLNTVFKGAWAEGHPSGAACLNLTGQARSFRDSSWWVLIRSEPYKRRKLEGLTQWKPGVVPSFDDIFVNVLGPDWRRTRDAGDKSAWLKLTHESTELLCDRWQLPGNPRARPTSLPRRVATRDRTAANLEYSKGHSEREHSHDDRWVDDRSRFLCVVDNQTLAAVVTGKVALQNAGCKAVIKGIVDSLAHLCNHHGLRPPRDHDDPVEWRPREYNKRADTMCNIILDGSDDFLIEGDNLETVLGLEPHLLIYTDGGCRHQGLSSIGYIIYGIIFGYGDSKEYYTLAMGGKKLAGDHDSFFLEARALEEALVLASAYVTAERGQWLERKRRKVE